MKVDERRQNWTKRGLKRTKLDKSGLKGMKGNENGQKWTTVNKKMIKEDKNG